MPFDEQRFRRALPAQSIGSTILYQPSVTSTMDVAREAGWGSVPHGLVVVADEQTAGRGRFGRRWVAPAGANLTFTILLRPDLAVLERLSMIAALAVADAVVTCTGLDVAFKWPNDIQLDGRKLAGILIEAEFRGEAPAFALAGIGLNVNQESAAIPEVREIAISLRDHLGREVERESLLASLLISFEWWTQPDTLPRVVEAWSSRLVTLGQQVSVTFAGVSQSGVAESVTESGALVLRRDDGSQAVLPAGEVTLRPPAP